MAIKPIHSAFSLVLLAFACGCASVPSPKEYIKIMSFNIRCGVCEDANDPNNWSKRKFLVAKILDEEKPDIIATQEAEDYQAEDMAKFANFSHYGIGREEGEKGERNAILWNPKRFTALKTQTIWLNPNGDKFKLGWDADWVRTLTMIEFQDIKTKTTFWVFDAHLDNEGKIARVEGAKIIIEQAKIRAPEPIILMGDLNDVAGSDAYLTLSSTLHPITNYAPDDYTFNGFGKDAKKGFAIDHIFTNFDAQENGFKIITKNFNGLYPSDHFPIVVNLKID
ncbi:endonuclease/exonuclease/phosphatase family protein [Pseudaquidulcibacter saccharophilus]|uniref:endonuclease/exonuclease/phosphatase family protein n=1 Tax=Pseudaquidulcibacter saccharophilus TaxID=2831900 RepID=UPI001EFF57E4|nr:endonuclease/exonuclease/phosphatase family protein [Pseudaquidulcibacter saccharophilus]